MKSKIYKKDIQKFLRECVFNPNDPGPLKVIVDTNNPDYFVMRAIEMIHLAQQSDMDLDYIRKAIGLLTLAACMEE